MTSTIKCIFKSNYLEAVRLTKSKESIKEVAKFSKNRITEEDITDILADGGMYVDSGRFILFIEFGSYLIKLPSGKLLQLAEDMFQEMCEY